MFGSKLSVDRVLAPIAAQSDQRPDKPRRDLKKLALIVGLSALSWLSTWTGMVELIKANLRTTMGPFELIATGCAVAMLQIMIVWLLDQLFSHLNLTIRALYAAGYLFLTLISVGFGFGFYWKVLESRSETTRSAETSINQVQQTFRATEARLEQLNQTLVNLTALSTTKAEDERAKGNTCPNSRPGDGPRRALRDADAQRFKGASDFVGGRMGQIRGDIKTFDGDLQKVLKMDGSNIGADGTRTAFLKGMGRNLDTAVTRLNAFRTDPQLRQIRNELAERADRTVFPDGRGKTYVCPDPQLQSALRGVVAAIDQLPVVEKPNIAITEGSEAVIEAFRRLTTTLFGALQFKLPPTPEELRAQQVKAVQSVENAAQQQRAIDMEAAGLGKRDYIPLGIALFVDFCLLLVSLGRPVNRFVAAKHQMREAEDGPQAEILAKFAEVHGHEWIRRNFEQFRHVIFDFMGDYYAAIPLGMSEEGRKRAPQAASKVDESTLMLTNLFAGLEQGRIFQRSMLLGVWPISAIVRRKLRRQGSVFADAGAFRFYRFKDRAWPEMILGAVMGAARDHRDELDEKRQRERQLWQAERDAEQAKAEALRAKAEADAQRVRAEAEAVKARAEEQRAHAELRRLEAELARKQLEDRQRAVERAINDPDPPSHRPVPPAPANGRPPRMQAAHDAMPTRAQGTARVEPVMPGLRVIPEPAAAMPVQSSASRASAMAMMHAGMANVATAAVIEPEPVPSFEFPVARPVAAVAPSDMPSGGLGETVAMASRSDNVLPMPPRSERTGTPEALPFADGPVQVLAPARTVEPVEGQPPAARPREATSTEIGELLKGVAVSQYHVAQDIAAAAHELSHGHRADAWRAARARAEAAAGPLVQDQLTARPAGVPVVDIQSGEIVRERAVWQAANPQFEAEQRAALEGRHEGFRENDDAGPMAQRLAPRLRPGK